MKRKRIFFSVVSILILSRVIFCDDKPCRSCPLPIPSLRTFGTWECAICGSKDSLENPPECHYFTRRTQQTVYKSGITECSFKNDYCSNIRSCKNKNAHGCLDVYTNFYCCNCKTDWFGDECLLPPVISVFDGTVRDTWDIRDRPVCWTLFVRQTHMWKTLLLVSAVALPLKEGRSNLPHFTQMKDLVAHTVYEGYNKEISKKETENWCLHFTNLKELCDKFKLIFDKKYGYKNEIKPLIFYEFRVPFRRTIDPPIDDSNMFFYKKKPIGYTVKVRMVVFPYPIHGPYFQCLGQFEAENYTTASLRDSFINQTTVDDSCVPWIKQLCNVRRTKIINFPYEPFTVKMEYQRPKAPECQETTSSEWQIFKDRLNLGYNKGDEYLTHQGSSTAHFAPYTYSIGVYLFRFMMMHIKKGEQVSNFQDCLIYFYNDVIRAHFAESVKVVNKEELNTVIVYAKDINRKPGEQEMDLFYTWSCKYNGTDQPCPEVERLFKNAPSFDIPPDTLKVNATYNFTVHVKSTTHIVGEDMDTSTTVSHMLDVTTAETYRITLFCATCDDSSVINPQEYNLILVRAKDGKSRPFPANYEWKFAEDTDKREYQPVESIKEENGTSYYVLKIKKDVLKYNTNYLFWAGLPDNDKVFAEIKVSTPPLHPFQPEDFNCTLNPMEGIRGWTDFNFECYFENAFLSFEYYDKDEKDELLFGGRMLGYNRFGSLYNFKMTRGKFFVLAFDKYTAKKNLTLIVPLEPFNDTLAYLEGLNNRAEDFVETNMFDWPSATVSSVADVTEQEMNPPMQIVKEPLLILNKVTIDESVELVKMVLSSLKVILENTDNKFDILELDAHLTKTGANVLSVSALKLMKREKNIELEKSLTRTIFFNMIKAILDCAEILLEQKNREYRSRPEEYVIPIISELVQDTSTVLVGVLETASYTLNSQQIPEDAVGEIISDRKKLLASTKVDFPADLCNWTSITANSSVVINDEVFNSFENTSQLGLQYILMSVNPFWWARGNIVTEVILVNLCKRTKLIECQKEKHFNNFINLHLKVIESLKSIASINSTAYQVDPKTTDDSKELELTVYRFFLPERAMFFLKFTLDETQAYRVMLTEGMRPDYASMAIKAKVINKMSFYYNVSYDNKYENEKIYYLGILPDGNVSIGERSPFSLKAYYSLCNTWVRWHWTSYGCWVGAETNDESMQCDCTHLSVVAGAMTVPVHNLSLVAEFLLYLTAWENLLPLFILLFILLIYFVLLIWSLIKDIKDRKEGEIIVLEDNFPGERYAYLLGVHTGSRMCSGTSAAVGVRLFGDSNDSRPHVLRSPERSVMKAFSEDWFLIYTPLYLGKIRRLWLWHDDKGSNADWYVERIDIYDLQTKVQYIFEINTWIAVEVDAYPDVFVAPVKINSYFSVANVFRNNFTNGARDIHVWTSVCLKHSRNPISRVDRVSVIACYVVAAMAVCLLFYLLYFGFYIDEDKPSFYLIQNDILIFILTLLTASVVGCLVMALFRRSFTHKYKVFMIPRTFRLSRQGDAWYEPYSFPDSEEDEFTTVREMNIGQSQNTFGAGNKRFQRFRIRKKPRQMRTTRENCALALHRIAQGTSLLPLRLPGSKSDLVIRKPWFFTGWLLCITITLISTFIILRYAWKLPTVKDEKFLATFLSVIVFEVIIISFLKILLFSAVLSYLFQNVLPGTTYHIRIKDGARLPLFGDTSFLAKLLQTRKQKIYYPLAESVKEKKKETKVRKYRWRIFLEFIMIFLLALVISMLCKIYYIDRYMSNIHATQLITTSDNINRLSIKQVLNRTDYFNYLEHTFVRRLYMFMWYNYEPLMNAESVRKDWAGDCITRLLGNTRIRQLRVSQGNCSMESISTEFCAPSWTDDQENKNVYSTGWQTAEYEDTLRQTTTWRYTDAESSNSSRFYGRSGTLYHGGGYIAVLGYSKRETRGTLVNLELEGWLDHTTRAVFVEFTLYNVNTDLFTQIVLVTEQHPTGQYISLPKVESVSINIGFDLWNISYIIFQVIFLLKTLYFMNRQGVFIYFSTVLNKYEVFLLALGFATVVVYVVHVKNSSLYIEEYHRKGLDEFFSFFKIIRYDFMSKAIMCFLFICIVIKLLLSWKFGRIYVSFYYTFLLSWSWIVWLTVYFIICLIILWRFIGYNLNVYIFSFYSIAVIYSKDFKISGEHNRAIEHVVVYLMCILSSFVIIMFIASFAHYYRVGKYFKITDNFNYGIFFKTELNRLVGRKKVDV